MGRRNSLIAPPLHAFSKGAHPGWEWRGGLLVRSHPLFWATTQGVHDPARGIHQAITAAGTPTRIVTPHGPGYDFAESGDYLQFGGATDEIVDYDGSPWTMEFIVRVDDFTGEQFPVILHSVALHGSTPEPFSVFFSNHANYNGINIGWGPADSGAKGDTVDSGLAGNDLVGLWSHVFVRYNGVDITDLSNFDCYWGVVGGSNALQGFHTFAANGAFAGVTNLGNRLGGNDGEFDGQMLLWNVWGVALTDAQVLDRAGNPFGMFEQPIATIGVSITTVEETVADGATATETATDRTDRLGTGTDGATGTDTATSEQTVAGAAGVDAADATDAATTARTSPVTMTDGVDAGEVATGGQVVQDTVSDGVEIGEAVGIAILTTLPDEGVNATDTATAALPTGGAAAADSADATDAAVSVLQTVEETTTDGVTATDAATESTTLTGSAATDGATAADDAFDVLIGTTSTSTDGATGTETATARKIARASCVDGTQATDVAVSGVTAVVVAPDGATLTEIATALLPTAVALATDIGTMTDTSSGGSAVRSVGVDAQMYLPLLSTEVFL